MKSSSRFNSRKTARLSPKKMVAIALVGTILLAGTLALLDARNIIDLPFFKDAQKTTSNEDTSNEVNYDPPTEEEKRETEAFKDDLVKDPTPTPPSSQGSQKKSVIPVITRANYFPDTQKVDASGFVAGILEEGGSCTLTLQKDGVSVTATSQATPNAQSVSCGIISIGRDKLSPGSWKAQLSYNSAAHEGTSQQDTTVDIN